MGESTSFSYWNPVRVNFGADCYLSSLAGLLGESEERVALFFGRGAMEKRGVIAAIRETLPRCAIREYGGIGPNPDVSDIDAVLRDWPGADRVIGVGGGSVIDFAKSVAFMAPQGDRLASFLTGHGRGPVVPGIPFVAIPTTSGTGSEVTHWATVWDREAGKKHSLSHPGAYPVAAIVDPCLTLGVPSYVTAYTGFDALSHALEAFWSRHANPVSDLYAIEAVRLVLDHLGPVLREPENLPHRTGMALASLKAGLAFSNTKTTAVHAISYPMTLRYGVPHGVACSLTVAAFFEYNLQAIDPVKVSRLLAATGGGDAACFAGRLRALAAGIGLPTTLFGAGIPREGIEVILDEGFHPDRVRNNPRELDRSDLQGILEEIYD